MSTPRTALRPRTWPPLAALLLALVLLAAACGGDEDGTSDDGGTDQTTEQTEQTDGGEPPGDLPTPPAPGEVAQISSAEGAALRASDRRVVFADVRPLEDYLAGHLVGAQHIPLEDSELWEHRTAALDPNHPIAVYCGTGALSARAAAALVDLGFSEVYDLGGLSDWDDGDLPLDRQPS